MPETNMIDRTELAARLAAATHVERAALLARYAALADVELAIALKELFDQHESSDPARAIEAAHVLEVLADATDVPVIHALAAWIAGMAAQLDGRLERSIEYLGSAEAQ
ncbi:MAG TPA: hypothetical protein VFO07_08190, partial [Roseiflexaceae bacterium]|nr:hypothetical protein [Roseiflexaceae bacterium]